MTHQAARSFLLGALIITMACTLERVWMIVIQASIGGALVGMAIHETLVEKEEK